MKIVSNFGLLDVKLGRIKLSNYFAQQRKATKKEGIGYRPVNPPIKVLIEAEIIDQWGHDDGTSIEFELKVKKVTVKD